MRDTVIRQLAREPPGWRPATLAVTIRRYRCAGCSHVWRQDTTLAAGPRATLPRRGLRRAPEAIVARHLTVAWIAEGPSVAWNTAHDAVLAEGKRALIDDTTRFDGVTAIGAGEHVRRHTRRGGKYVTVITGLTGIRDGTGPARLPGMVQGRSRQAFKTGLSQRPKDWRDGTEVVAVDGFTGFKTATAEELPNAVTVMDSFIWSAWGDAWIGAGDGSSRASTATEAARTTLSTGPGGPCTPVPARLPASRRIACSHCSRPMSTSRPRRPGPSTSR